MPAITILSVSCADAGFISSKRCPLSCFPPMGLTYQSRINRELTTMLSHPIAFPGKIQTNMVLLQDVLMMKTMMLMMRRILVKIMIMKRLTMVVMIFKCFEPHQLSSCFKIKALILLRLNLWCRPGGEHSKHELSNQIPSNIPFNKIHIFCIFFDNFFRICNWLFSIWSFLVLIFV